MCFGAEKKAKYGVVMISDHCAAFSCVAVETISITTDELWNP